ncbi:MAG: DUF1573 domain-containing protein [Cyclobacteriaceae bacterium]
MMKRTFLILMLGITVAAIASVSPLTWKSTSLDLGEIKTNETVDLSFEFTNTANEAVTILEAKGSCGCTKVSYSKEQIAPGESAQITAKFKSSKSGTFRKTIKIKTSASAEATVLSFKGTAI